MTRVITLLTVLAALQVANGGAQQAIEWDGSQAVFFSDNDGPFVLGFRFRAESNITVTALGAFDYLGDGLAQPHIVGIWSATGGTPIVTATVPSGIDASLLGQFRYVGIPGIWLSANSEYVVGVSDFYGSDNDIYAWGVPVDGFSTASAVTYLGPHQRSSSAGTLRFPLGGINPLDPLDPGANFQFVPGPLLAIKRLGSLGVELNWTTNATGYHLEDSRSVSLTDWNAVTNVSTVVGATFVVALTNDTGGQRFFRLRKP